MKAVVVKVKAVIIQKNVVKNRCRFTTDASLIVLSFALNNFDSNYFDIIKSMIKAKMIKTIVFL
jgi:hypothetical protein